MKLIARSKQKNMRYFMGDNYAIFMAKVIVNLNYDWPISTEFFSWDKDQPSVILPKIM